ILEMGRGALSRMTGVGRPRDRQMLSYRAMKASTDRTLTTHTDSLPLPNDLTALLEALDTGTVPGAAAFDARERQAVADVVRAQRDAGGANPRHEHAWAVFREIRLPGDRLIIPGVLDSTTNFIEHPELVAERIVRYAEVVGRGARHRRQRLRLS